MATTYPAGSTTDSSSMTTVIGVLALIAIVALVYFIARGSNPTPATTGPAERVGEQVDDAARAPAGGVNPNR